MDIKKFNKIFNDIKNFDYSTIPELLIYYKNNNPLSELYNKNLDIVIYPTLHTNNYYISRNGDLLIGFYALDNIEFTFEIGDHLINKYTL